MHPLLASLSSFSALPVVVALPQMQALGHGGHDLAFDDRPPLHDFSVVESQHGVPGQAQPPIVRDIGPALLALMERVAVELDDEPSTDEDVHTMPEQRYLLQSSDPDPRESMDDDRLQARIGCSIRFLRESSCCERGPVDHLEMLGRHESPVDRGLPDGKPLDVRHARGDARENVLDRIDRRPQGDTDRPRVPVDDEARQVPTGMGMRRKMHALGCTRDPQPDHPRR